MRIRQRKEESTDRVESSGRRTKRGTMQRLIFEKQKSSYLCAYDHAFDNSVKAFIRQRLMFPPASVSFIVLFAVIFDCMFLLFNALNGWYLYLL